MERQAHSPNTSLHSRGQQLTAIIHLILGCSIAHQWEGVKLQRGTGERHTRGIGGRPRSQSCSAAHNCVWPGVSSITCPTLLVICEMVVISLGHGKSLGEILSKVLMKWHLACGRASVNVSFIPLLSDENCRHPESFSPRACISYNKVLSLYFTKDAGSFWW